MDSIDWVRPYINRIFSSDPDKEGEALKAEKLSHINIPFYKYCYICENGSRTENTIDFNIENFANDELFFQSPEKFNDPFDCFLGFSQVQAVRDVIIAELKKQKKYTGQMHKAITSFFNDDLFEAPPIETMLGDGSLLDLVEAVLPLVADAASETAPETGCVKSILSSLIEQDDGKKLFIKLIKNTLTIHDKQMLIDLFYKNEEFRAYNKERIVSENKDQILEMAQHDMKLKIETTPNSLLCDTSSSSFAFIDFFQMLIKAALDRQEIPEFADIKKSLLKASDEALNKSRKIISEQCRITCLSERMDSPLMWSHYANKHFGFCIEYDFTHTMLKRYPDLTMAQLMMFPVIYSSERPLISRAFFNSKTMLQYMKNKTIPADIIKSIIYGLLFKSEDWSYEREWRIIMMNSSKPTMKLPPARKVFLGVNMEDEPKDRILTIAKRKNIPVYQMVLSADKYRFDHFCVT